jgi:RNA polymerase sigma-70 factor (ECF subfamily)
MTNEDILKFIPAIKRFANYLCKDKNDADDLMQESLINAILNKDKFRDGTNLEAWLLTITKYKFYSNLGKNQNKIFKNSCEIADNKVVFNTAFSNMNTEFITSIIEKLPKQHKEVFMLHLQGFTYREIGKKLAITQSAAHDRMTCLKKVLVKRLKLKGYERH